jgi:hypothetical protein
VETWNTQVDGLGDIPNEVGIGLPPEVLRTSLPIDQIVNLSTVGLDTSSGKSKELYGTSLQVEPEVLKLLCPKGVTAAVQKDIMETLIDVSSLPGKFTSNDTVDGALIMVQFAQAVGDLSDNQARRVGGTCKFL